MADTIVAECELSLEEIQNMKVTDLRKKLKIFGLPITGNKTELVERLQEAVSSKGNDSFENSQLSYDESQINELDSAEVLEDSALFDQDQISSYISSSSEDNPKILGSVENKSSSNSVIMPPKKRTFTKIGDVETAEKKVFLNRTNATDIDFEIEENQTESKPVIVSSDKESSSDEKIKLSLKTMSAAERLAMRAKRFNTNDSGVKTATSVKSIKSIDNRNSKESILSSATAPDLDVLKKRAERFGQCVSTVMKQIEQKERLLKRKCKFGSTLAAVSAAPSLGVPDKKKQRAERFGML